MKLKFRSIFRNISLTFIAEGIVLAAFFFIYRLIAKNFGPEGVGEYSLMKKVFGFLQPFLLLGLGIGLPRYLAMSQNKEQRSNYIKTGGLVVAILTFVFLIFINLFRDYFAKIFFGTTNYINLVLPFSFFLAGLTLHVLVYSYFRGRLFVKTFNFLQIINAAFVPIIILIFLRDITIERFITLIGITTFVIAFLFLLFFIKEFFVRIEKLQFKNSLKELLHYSFPRFINNFVSACFLSLGPIFAAHFVSIRNVGYLSVSQSLLGAVGIVAIPFSIILLPKVGNLIKQKREEEIKENLNFLIGVTVQGSIFICFQMMIFSDVIIKFWLGSEFLDATPVMRIIFVSIISYLFCGVVGSILEASKVKPINLINSCISLGVFFTISGILLLLVKLFPPIISLSIAFTSGFVCLGILTYISIRKIYFEKLNKDLNYLWVAIGINTLLGGITLLTKSLVASRFYYLVIFEILLGVIYLLILWLLKTDWLRKIPEKVLLK